ncbi:MAG: FAD-dependent oxidoreductase [Myxococcota bacterium]
MAKDDRKIAILGAGGAGACTALELAQRGFNVELFERQPEALSQASFANEGKIHLGLIYAKDTSLATAAQMIEGALEFEGNLERWVSFSAADVISTPFVYGVHKGSLLSPEAIEAHYQRCHAHYAERAAATGLDYLGLGEGSHSRRLDHREWPDTLSPEFLEAIFETKEYAVDPRAVAEILRKGLAHEPRIQLRTDHRVLGIEPSRTSGFKVRFEVDGQIQTEWFSDVANTTWHERLPLDRPLGIQPPAAYSHRYKFGHRLALPLRPDELPSITCVQGPFGDIVNFGDRGAFLSWYPCGRTEMSTEESPPDWHAAYTPEERFAVFDRSLEACIERCPALATLPLNRNNVDPYGGVIYALGTTDVDDEKSGLHERFEIGIQSRGRYHSLDPGKYTLVPYWALRLADRIEAAAG